MENGLTRPALQLSQLLLNGVERLRAENLWKIYQKNNLPYKFLD